MHLSQLHHMVHDAMGEAWGGCRNEDCIPIDAGPHIRCGQPVILADRHLHMI